MIFVTLGSQKFQFNRLLETMDSLDTNEEIFAQTGYSDYKPKNYKYKNFIDKTEFIEIVNKSNIVITHGGAGTIINSIKMGKKVIAVPRLKKYNEHVDDHQVEIVKEFNNSNLIYGCFDCAEINKAIKEVKKKTFSKYISNTHTIIDDLEEYLQNLEI